MKKILVLLMLLCSSSYAATVTVPTVWRSGDTVTDVKLNNINNAFTAAINGGLDNTNANTVGGYHFFQSVATLPAAGNQGTVDFQASDNTLNIDNGSAWLSTVTPSGTLGTGKIPYYNSGWQLLTPGAQNLPLVSNGASSLPTYQTLPIAGGGTGQVTAQAAVDALLPSQTSNSGKVLGTNGTTSSWVSGASFVPTNIQVFTANGTWTKPAGISSVYVKVWGAGGASCADGITSNRFCSPGSGGGYSEGFVSVTGNVTVTVGTGGTAATGFGNAGGNSSFAASGGTIQGTGGGGGNNNSTSNAGGSGSGGSINISGQTGQGVTNMTPQGQSPAPTGGAAFSSAGGTGAMLSGGNQAVGLPGMIPGGGGGAGIDIAGTESAGGAGADGRVIVYY